VAALTWKQNFVRAIGRSRRAFLPKTGCEMLRAVRFATVLDYKINNQNLGRAGRERGVDQRDQRGTYSRGAG